MPSVAHFFKVTEDFEVQAVCGTIMALVNVGAICLVEGKIIFSGMEEQMLDTYIEDCKKSYEYKNDMFVVTTIDKIIESQHIKNINELFNRMYEIGCIMLKKFDDRNVMFGFSSGQINIDLMRKLVHGIMRDIHNKLSIEYQFN
jgi:hypothetical protein